MKKQIFDFTNHIAKGMIAFFIIKLVLISGFFFLQSCTQEHVIVNESIENAEDEFFESLKQTRESFRNIPIVLSNLENNVFRINTSVETSIMVKVLTDIVNIQLNSIADVTNALVNGDVTLVLNPYLIHNEDANLIQIQVPQSELRAALSNTINAAKHYLITTGFSNSEINEMLLGYDESILIILVHASIVLQNENIYTTTHLDKNDFLNLLFGIQSAQAQISWKEVGGCAAAAIGLDIIQEMRAETAGKKMTKKVLKKAFEKVTAKLASYLTGFGLAWTAAYFVGCLGYAYFN